MAWQPVSNGVKLRIVNQAQQPVARATVQLMRPDSVIVKVQVSDQTGMVEFNGLAAAKYILQVSHSGFQPGFNTLNFLEEPGWSEKLMVLLPTATELGNVIIESKKPFVQF